MPENTLRVADSGYDYELEIIGRYNDPRVLQQAAFKLKDYLADELAEEIEFEHAGYQIRAVRQQAGDESC